jgi:hypothetical protein
VLPFTQRLPGGQHWVELLHVAASEQQVLEPPSLKGRHLKPVLAQHSPLQQLNSVPQQTPPQQRFFDGQELELEQVFTDDSAACGAM